MNKTLIKQLSLIAAVVLVFVIINTGLYFGYTVRFLPDSGELPGARVISLEKYLPFAEDSEVVKLDGGFKLTGDLPVIDGAEGLYPVFSAVAYAIYPEDSVHFDGENFTSDSALRMNNTLRAYRGVVDGDCDIAFCASPSAGQLAYAEEKGAELEFVPIGREAFVFLTNVKNPVDSLTCEEVRDIYSGKIKSWSEVGGERRPIHAITRIEGSGSQSALVGFMKGERIARDLDAFLGGAPLGFSFRYYANDVIENGRVKLLALDGVYPDKASVADGSYPVISDFYAVYNKANTNPNVGKVIDFLLSDKGQEIIEETGYVKVTGNG